MNFIKNTDIDEDATNYKRGIIAYFIKDYKVNFSYWESLIYMRKLMMIIFFNLAKKLDVIS